MAASDRRVRRSRKSLHDALKALVSERPYADITIQDILERANVGRSTFYTHFRDKDDLLLAGLEELTLTAPESLLAFSRPLFDRIREFRGLLTTAAGRDRLQTLIAGMLRRECADELKRLRKPVTAELFVRSIAATFMTVVAWWLDHRTGLSVSEVDEVFQALAMPMLDAVVYVPPSRETNAMLTGSSRDWID